MVSLGSHDRECFFAKFARELGVSKCQVVRLRPMCVCVSGVESGKLRAALRSMARATTRAGSTYVDDNVYHTNEEFDERTVANGGTVVVDTRCHDGGPNQLRVQPTGVASSAIVDVVTYPAHFGRARFYHTRIHVMQSSAALHGPSGAAPN